MNTKSGICQFLLIIFYFFQLYSCTPTRIGKTKRIVTDLVVKLDTLYMYRGFFSYSEWGDGFGRPNWWIDSISHKVFEKNWDSIVLVTAKSNFIIDSVFRGSDGIAYGLRPFKFKVLLGYSDEIASDSLSWLVSSALWNIRAGKMQEGLKMLPDVIIKKSFEKPVLLHTSDFFFYEVDFAAGYSVGTTGLQVIPNLVIAIVKNGEVAFFNNYRKGLLLKRFTSGKQQKRYASKLFKGVKMPKKGHIRDITQ